MYDEVRWDEFLDGGAFDEIMKGSNKNWMVAIKYELTGEICEELLFEFPDNIKREDILSASSYVKYEIKEIINNESPSRRAVVYKYIEKIIDLQNNLIIVSYEDPCEIHGRYPIEEELEDNG